VKFVSLFAGIGGFDLAFEEAGMECVAQVEIDEQCNQVLTYYFPTADRRIKDVKEFTRDNFRGAVDLICGGFPCQDLSVAGKREGLAGERSGLWFEFRRILEEFRPGWVVVENVPGLLSSFSGPHPPSDLAEGEEWEATEESDFGIVLRGLAELGYGVTWRVLDAQFFGVPQRRRRVFVVGSLGNGRSAQVLFERKGGTWDPPPSRKAGKRIAIGATASPEIGSGYRVEPSTYQSETSRALTACKTATGRLDPNEQEFVVAGTLNSGGNNGGFRTEPGEHIVAQPVAPAISASNPYGDHESREGLLIAHTLKAEGVDASEDGTGRGIPIVAAHDTGQGWWNQADVAGTLRAEGENRPSRPSNIVAFGVSENQRAETRLTDYSRQITSGGGKPGQGYPAALTSYGVRRLTPRECERLQGFPDDHTAGQSDSARYRQLGNAVNKAVALWIGKRIMEVENG
jgi:DNA (cytosine-5)-methyltransferase 1